MEIANLFVVEEWKGACKYFQISSSWSGEKERDFFLSKSISLKKINNLKVRN